MRRQTSVILVVAGLFVLAVLGAAGPPGRAEDGEPLLLRLARPDEPGFDDALASWEALSEAEKVALLREGLASSDRALAEVAAAEIGGEYLSLAEIHRRQALLRHRFEAAVGDRAHDWGLGGVPPAGAPDVVPLWRALASRDGMPRSEVLEELHRATLPSHLPDLVPLLVKGGGEYFRALFWTVCLVADADASDRYRTEAERGILYGLRRLRAERHYDRDTARKALSLDPDPPAWAGDGLPAGFVEVARAAWGLDPDGYRNPKDADRDALEFWTPLRWIHRQALRFTPVESDGFFLADVVRSADATTGDRWWAMRHLLRLSPEWGGELVEKHAQAGRNVAVEAVAALAQAGRRERWAALAEDEKAATPLAWAVDPEQARERWRKAFLAIDESADVLASLDVRYPLPLDPLSRARYLHDWGIAIPEEDLRWIAGQLDRPEVHPLLLAAFLASTLPDDLTPDRAADLASRLAAAPAPIEGEDWLNYAGVEETLAALEVAHPDAFRGLLRAWVPRLSEGDRTQVHVWLARMGDASDVPALLASWPDWDLDRPALGYVRDERVTAFLRARLVDETGEVAGSALVALCVQQGVPAVLLDGFYRGEGDAEGEGEDAWKEAVRLLLAGDAVGAVLAVRWSLAELGLLRDSRVVPVLEAARAARHESTYWDATAGLALHGNAAARTELLEIVREGRMWFFDGVLQGPRAVVPTCDGDPEFLAAWTDLVESNCCLGWAAQDLALRERFPTIPVSCRLDGFTTSADAAAWLERYRGRLCWSHVRGGWLPGPRTD